MIDNSDLNELLEKAIKVTGKKTSEKLLSKLKSQFPHLPINDDDELIRVYGLSDTLKWSNFGASGNYIYSYDTMTDCLKHKIEAVFCDGLGHSTRGWEIFVVE